MKRVVMTKRRWLLIVVVAALAGTGITLWAQLPQEPTAKNMYVSVTPAFNNLGMSALAPLQVSVYNGTGGEVTDADLRVSVTGPGGDYPQVVFSPGVCENREPGGAPECEDPEKHAKSLGCEPKPVGGKSGMACDGGIPEGGYEYEFGFGTGEVPPYEELGELTDYPALRIHAELRVGGKVLGSDEERLWSDMPEGYGAMKVEGLPKDLGADDPPSRVHDWSFTLENRTEQDVGTATMTIKVVTGADSLELDSDHKGCRNSTDSEVRSRLKCLDVNMPVGEKLTFDMRMNVAEGARARLEELCPPKAPDSEECLADAREGRVYIEMRHRPRSSEVRFVYAELPVKLNLDD